MRLTWRLASLGGLAAVVALAATAHSPARLLAVAEAAAADPLVFGGVVLALYAVRPALLWPPTLVAVVVGYGYGLAVGVPVALAGAVLTSGPPYLAARWLGRDAPVVARLQDAGEGFFGAAGPVRGVTAGRLAPLPADAVTCAAAVSGVSFGELAAGILVGELPWTVAAVAAGASLATLTTDGVTAGGLRLAVLGTVAALGVLAGPAYRRYGDRLRPTPAGQ